MSDTSAPLTSRQLAALLPEVTARLVQLVQVAESLAADPELVLPDESGGPRTDPKTVNRLTRQLAVWANGIGGNIGGGHVREALHSLRHLLTRASTRTSDPIAETGHANAHEAAWAYVKEVWSRAAGAVYAAKCRAIRQGAAGKKSKRKIDPYPYRNITLAEWERYYPCAAQALCSGPGRPPRHLLAWVRREYVIARDLLLVEPAGGGEGRRRGGRKRDKLKQMITETVLRERDRTPPTPWKEMPAVVAAKHSGVKRAVETLKSYYKQSRKA